MLYTVRFYIKNIHRRIIVYVSRTKKGNDRWPEVVHYLPRKSTNTTKQTTQLQKYYNTKWSRNIIFFVSHRIWRIIETVLRFTLPPIVAIFISI